MKPLLHITLFLFLMGCTLLAQSQVNFRMTQFTEILSFYNPAFGGLENHTDMRFGLRRQWNEIDNAPLSFFTHMSGSFAQANQKRTRGKKYKSPYDIDQMVDRVNSPNNGLRMSDPHLHRKMVRDSIVAAVKKLDRKGKLNLKRQLRAKNKLKFNARHGYTTTLMSQQNGAITQFSLNAGYAYHLPIARRMMLSMGLSATLLNSRFDADKAVVANQINDQLYQQYASGGMNDYAFYISPGMNLYNDRFYASYSINKIVSDGLGGHQLLSTQNVETQHNIAMGTSLELSSNVSLHPAFIFSLKESLPYTTLFSARLFYQEQLWLGLHYDLNHMPATSFGFFFRDQYKFSYAYEFQGVQEQNQLGATHEVMLGILINKGSAPNPLIK